jgi:hypothetical protein
LNRQIAIAVRSSPNSESQYVGQQTITPLDYSFLGELICLQVRNELVIFESFERKVVLFGMVCFQLHFLRILQRDF